MVLLKTIKNNILMRTRLKTKNSLVFNLKTIFLDLVFNLKTKLGL